MKNFAILLSLLIASISTPTLATEVGKTYFEAGYARITYKESGIPNYSLGALKGTYGVVVSEGIALEGSLAAGVSDDTQTITNTSVKLSLDYMYGVYARPFWKIGDKAEIFGRLGYTKGKLKATAGNQNLTTDGSDFSYGLGAAFNLSKDTQMVVDYMSYYDKSDTEIAGFGIALKWNF